jgi:hypothetical protein
LANVERCFIMITYKTMGLTGQAHSFYTVTCFKKNASLQNKTFNKGKLITQVLLPYM